MANQPPARRGLTPGKLGLIITLSVVLLVVIVVQFGGGSSSSRKSPRPRRVATTKTAAKSEPQSKAKPAKQAVDLEWPAYQVNDVLDHNPFALPGELRTTEAVAKAGSGQPGASVAVETADNTLRLRQSEFIASLREQGVDMVLMTPGGSVARVGRSSFRVGDVVEGLVVTEISSSGIVFEHEDPSDADRESTAKPANLQAPQPEQG